MFTYITNNGQVKNRNQNVNYSAHSLKYVAKKFIEWHEKNVVRMATQSFSRFWRMSAFVISTIACKNEKRCDEFKKKQKMWTGSSYNRAISIACHF